MSAEFDAVVTLCRLAVNCELIDASLRLTVPNGPNVERLVSAAAPFRVAEIYLGGQQQHRRLAELPSSERIEIRFEGLASNQKVIRQNLVDLLNYQQGMLLYKAPQEYLLLDEQYATGDDDVPELVQAYQRIPRFVEVVSSVADVVLGEGTISPTFVLLAGKRMDFTPVYDVGTLKSLPSTDSIDALLIELRSAPFIEAKQSLFKKVLVRLLEATSTDRRFSELAQQFDVVKEAFAADFDLYRTEFNFEKVRESFEQKRLTFVLQLNATTSDLLGKMLAIPIGQGLVVSQMKSDPAASVGNFSLALGSIVFAVIASLLLLNHHHSLRQIKNEIAVERESLKTRFPQLHQRLKEMFDMLKTRAAFHTWAFPAAVMLLLLATTAYSVYAFTRVPPLATITSPAAATVVPPAAPPAAPTAGHSVAPSPTKQEGEPVPSK